MFGYRVPAPNEALLISGRKQRGADALPFKIVTGHGAFVVPVFAKASRLTLAMQEAEVEEAGGNVLDSRCAAVEPTAQRLATGPYGTRATGRW